jgi:sensor histidine kinase regulating citrate/malate metabolism
MTKHHEQTTTQQIGGDGIIIVDAEGGIVRMKQSGHEHLTLLSKADMDEALTHLGRRSFDALLAALREGDLNQEIVTEEPRLYVLEVLALPIVTGFRIDGWALTVRDVTDSPQEPANSRPPGQSRSVFHWPPNSSLTSNIT